VPPMAVVSIATSFLLLVLPRSCHGYFAPVRHCKQSIHRQSTTLLRALYPTRLEDWNNHDVEGWLSEIEFGRYSPGFASDYSGIGVDGDRLVYLGTEDQLDHIEFQLSLIGVDDASDQVVLGKTIIELVAASEVTPELLQSLAENVPIGNRDANHSNGSYNDKNEGDDDENNWNGGVIHDYEI